MWTGNARSASRSLVAIIFGVSALVVSWAQSVNRTRTPALPTLAKMDHWFTLAPSVDDFSVEIPCLTMFTAPAEPHTYVCEQRQSAYALMSYPQAVNENESSIERQLNGFAALFSKMVVERFAKRGSKYESAEPRKLNLNGVAGIEFSVSDAEDICLQRFYRTPKQVYSLMVKVPVAEKSSAERFLNSFTLERKAPLQFVEPLPPGATPNYGDPKAKPTPAVP